MRSNSATAEKERKLASPELGVLRAKAATAAERSPRSASGSIEPTLRSVAPTGRSLARREVRSQRSIAFPDNRQQITDSPKDESAGVDNRAASGAFTLLELLVVIGIISVLLVAIVPAVNSLSKSNGRKAAIGNLLGALEQARSAAIKDGQPTYVVFPTFSTASPSILDRYNYKSYSIFEDDPANPTTPKQLANWKTLASGVALRAKQSSGYAVTNLVTPAALPTPTPSFKFTPDTSSSPTFYLLKFNAAGALDAPQNNVVLGVFEGFVSNGNETFTCSKDKNGEPLASEYLSIGQYSGRAAPTATPAPTP